MTATWCPPIVDSRNERNFQLQFPPLAALPPTNTNSNCAVGEVDIQLTEPKTVASDPTGGQRGFLGQL